MKGEKPEESPAETINQRGNEDNAGRSLDIAGPVADDSFGEKKR